MLRIGLGTIAICVFTASFVHAQEPATALKVDKAKLEAYLRYAEGFTPSVVLRIGEPAPTGSPELWEVAVRVSLGPQSFDKTYYITADQKEIIGGKLWYLGESPFSSVLKMLPADGYSFGPANAKVTIVVFSDFECPYCRQLAQNLRQNVPKFYPNDVRVLYADYPLTQIHPWAMAMAEAARCVAEGNAERFWTFHDWVYDHQGEINKENLKEKVLSYAKDHNLDSSKIGTCIDTHATLPEVQRTVQMGDKLDVQQTPVLFVNGRMLGGAIPWQTVEAVIKLELQRATEGSGSTAGKNQ